VVSKIIVVATLSHREIKIVPGVLTLLVLRNSGAAFSIGTSMTVVFTLIAVGVIFFILRTSRQLRSLPWAVTLGLLLGGATGNLTDRLLRSPGLFRGNVVDWIQLPHWPVFNVADSAIVCGGVLAVLLAAWGFRLDGTRDGHGGHSGASGHGGSSGASGHSGPGSDPQGGGQAGGPGPTQAPGSQARQREGTGEGEAQQRGSAPGGQAKERGSTAGDSRA
jgi:lipoprotein signal peptidase